MRVEARIAIARPPEEVWEFVVDHSNDPTWCRKVKAAEPAGGAKWKVWHKPVPLRPVALLETTHLYEDPPDLAIREEDPSSVFDVEYRLERTSRERCSRRSVRSNGRHCLGRCRPPLDSGSGAMSRASFAH